MAAGQPRSGDIHTANPSADLGVRSRHNGKARGEYMVSQAELRSSCPSLRAGRSNTATSYAVTLTTNVVGAEAKAKRKNARAAGN